MTTDSPSTVTEKPGPSFFEQLLPASFRDLPFFVFGGQARFGRRNAMHEYPFRDAPWIEDLGRQSRRISMTGFITKGETVIAQRKRFIEAAEKPGDGVLIHPTLGRMVVSLMEFESIERWDRGSFFELNFTFVEAGKRQFPDEAVDGTNAIGDAAEKATASAGDTWTKAVKKQLGQNVDITAGASAMAQQWGANAVAAAGTATNAMNLATSLQGNFGRLLGQNSGIPIDAIPLPGVSLQGLLGLASAARSGVGIQVAALNAVATGLGLGSLAAFTAQASILAAAVRSAAFTPADGVTSMVTLAALPQPSDAAGAATADLFRRVAVGELVKASAAYQPSTTDEATAVRAQVLASVDAEMAIAGEQGDDEVYTALRGVRAEVIRDMNAKGAQLPSLITVTTARPTPSLALAQKLYRDPSRNDELERRGNPPHPAFMPTRFTAPAR